MRALYKFTKRFNKLNECSEPDLGFRSDGYPTLQQPTDYRQVSNIKRTLVGN